MLVLAVGALVAPAGKFGIAEDAVKESFVVAVKAALALDDVSRAEELLALKVV